MMPQPSMLRERVDQPREPLRLRRQVHDVEGEALAFERTADEHEIVAELTDDVVDHAVVGGCGGAEHRHVGGEEIEHAREAAIVGAEVVAPVADAVRLVDDEQADPCRDPGEHVAAELGVGEALGRDEQDVDARRRRAQSSICSQVSLLSLLIVAARMPPRVACSIWLRISASSGETSSVGPLPAGAQQHGGDEVDRALAPAGALHAEHPLVLLDERFDGRPLAVAEIGVGTDERAQGRERRIGAPARCARR